MQNVVLEFSDRKVLDEAVRHIWDRLAISGEISIAPREDGGWRLEIVSEKPIRPNTVDKLGGRIVED